MAANSYIKIDVPEVAEGITKIKVSSVVDNGGTVHHRTKAEEIRDKIINMLSTDYPQDYIS